MKLLENKAVSRWLTRLRRTSKEKNRWDRCKAQLLTHLGVDLVIDVGANRGQYGRHLRDIGYRGRIVSLEPASSAYGRLVSVAASDDDWTTRQLALGARPETRQLHIAGNIGMSSSLLAMLPAHQAAMPESTYVGVESVETMPLDMVFGELSQGATQICLKLDVQGLEGQILDGAVSSLSRIVLLELESSLVPLYEGETLFPAMASRLALAGFLLVGVTGSFDDARTGQLLQVDCLFARRDRFPNAAA